MVDLKRGKILFVDDQVGTVAPLIEHLREEGFTNIVHHSDIRTFSQLEQIQADLVFLDIGGVGTGLDSKEEGLSLLRYLKHNLPWVRVVVLSGSEFAAGKAPDLALADQCRTKGSLSLAEFTALVRNELQQSMMPEWRNPRIAQIVLNRLDELNIGRIRKWRVRRVLKKGLQRKGDEDFDWAKFTTTTRNLLALASDMAGVVTLLV
jgi:DNA-binding response OmpR family regulator